MGRQIDLKLVPLNTTVGKAGGFKAMLDKSRNSSMSYDQVLEEIVSKNRLGMSKSLVQMILDMAFNTVIDGVLSDGVTRRLGDFLQIGLEVKGRFISEGDQFDEDRHELALSVRTLKEMRRKPGRDGVRVINRNAGPKVLIESLYSVGCESGELTWGADIVLEGENLYACEDGRDEFQIKYFAKHGVWFTASGFLDRAWVSSDGRKAVIPWRELNLDQFEVGEHGLPKALMVGYTSRGGVATAKSQLHRGKAYFDGWLKKYPDYRNDFGKMNWGSIR